MQKKPNEINTQSEHNTDLSDVKAAHESHTLLSHQPDFGIRTFSM